MMPILPFITDSKENILSIVRMANKCAAKFIYPWIGMSLRSGQREYFYRALDRLYPGVGEKYKETYKDSYE